MKEKLPRDPMLDAVPFETNRFMDGKYIPDDEIAFLDLNKDKDFKKHYNSFYYGNDIDPEEKERILNGTQPVIITQGTVPIPYETYKKGTEQFNQLTTIKLPWIDKIRWRYRKHESVKTSRWNRNHTKVAEFYWFWEIICRNAKMYIPLEDQFKLQAAFRQIPVPTLEVRMPEL